MSSNINKNKFFVFFFHLCITLLISIIGLTWVFSSYKGDVSFRLFVFCWISNLLFLWCLYSWKKLNKSIFTPYSIFLTSAFLFFLGQAFLFSLDLEYKRFNLFLFFTYEQLLEAVIFTTISLALLHLGAMLTLLKSEERNQFSIYEIQNRNLLISVRRVAIFLFLLSVYPHLSHYFGVALTSIEFGYRELYENPGSSNIISTIRLFFIPSCFLLFAAYKNNKFLRYMIVILIILSVILGYIGGGRGQSTALLVSFIWLWHVQIKPFKGFKALILIVSGFMLLILLNVIGLYRNIENKSLYEFTNLFSNILIEDNPFVNIIGELGMTLFPLVQVMELMPEMFSYKFGLTFLFAFIMVLPNFLRFGLLGVAEEKHLISLGEWLMNTLDMSYGPGFSIIAEAFYNFGWLGILFMIVFGYIVALLIRSKSKSKDFLLLRNTFSAVILYFIILMVRGSSLLLIKYQVYYVLVPLLLIILLYNYMSNKKEEKNNAR